MITTRSNSLPPETGVIWLSIAALLAFSTGLAIVHGLVVLLVAMTPLILVLIYLYTADKPFLLVLIAIPSLILSPTIATTLFPPFAELRISDLFILMLFCNWILHQRSSFRIKINPETKKLLSFIVAFVLSFNISNIYASAILGAPLGLIEILTASAPIQYTLHLTASFYAFRRDKYGVKGYYLASLIPISVSECLGVLQYLNIGNARAAIDAIYPKFLEDASQFSEYNMRITSTFDGSPNVFAAFLVIFACILVGYTIAGSTCKKKCIIEYVMIGITFLVVFLTGSRSQMLAALASLSFFAILFRKRLLSVLVTIPIIYLCIAPETQLSRWSQISFGSSMTTFQFSGGTDVRLQKLQTLLPTVMEKSPIFGFGTSQYFGSTSDNHYLRTLVDGGLVALLMSFILMAYIFRIAYKVYRTRTDVFERGLGLGMMGATIAIMIGNIGARVLSMPKVDEFFWITTGILCAIVDSPQATQAGIKETRLITFR